MTASGTQPIAARIATYIPKSASAIMVGPEIVPPGRNDCGSKRLPDPAAAVPDLVDGRPALRVEHLRKFGRQQALELRRQ